MTLVLLDFHSIRTPHQSAPRTLTCPCRGHPIFISSKHIFGTPSNDLLDVLMNTSSWLLNSLQTRPSMTSTATFQFLTIDKHPNNIYVITLRRESENKLTAPFCQEIIRAFHTIHRELGAKGECAVITRGSNEKFWW